MAWTLEDYKNFAAAIQSITTALSFPIGGAWIYQKYIRQQERYPHIELSADIEFIGEQGGSWIVELIATMENKNKAQHKISNLDFDLNAIHSGEEVHNSEKWGGQVNFPHNILHSSFLPKKFDFFFIDPGTKAKYSHIAKIPNEVSFIILHCWFSYSDKRKFSHTAEKTVQIPKGSTTADSRCEPLSGIRPATNCTRAGIAFDCC